MKYIKKFEIYKNKQESYLFFYPDPNIDLDMIKSCLDDNGYHYQDDVQSIYFPTDKDNIDQLQNELQELFDNNGISGYFETSISHEELYYKDLTPEEVEQLKNEIDQMSHEEMAKLWRFGELGNKFFKGEVGEYFKDRLFNHHGGFNSTLSKKIGW